VRVLVVHPGASWSTADVDAGLRWGLQHHGVEVIEYRLDSRIDHSQRWLYRAWRRSKARHGTQRPTTADVFYHAGVGAIERALRHQVDAVIVVSAMFMHPDVIIMLKRAGVRVVALFTESPYDLPKELQIARLVDGCWTIERSSVPAFEAVNRNVGYLRHAWLPGRHTAEPDATDPSVPAHDVVFVGSAFRERVDFFNAIDWTGIDLGLYGNWTALSSRHRLRHFVRPPSPVPNALTAALYRRAKVTINLYRTSQGFGKDAPSIEHAESLNPRAYELAACGAVSVSSYRAEVPEVFGALVPTITTPAEAEATIRALLEDDDQRTRIAKQLPSIVARHSWADRARQVIGDLQTLLRAAA